MRIKERVKMLEGLAGRLKKEFEEEKARRIGAKAEPDEAIECHKVRELMELPSNRAHDV